MDKRMKKILFLHGFFASGQCIPAMTLQEAFEGKAQVLSPDLPTHPRMALEQIKSLCDKEQPDMIVGNSCGSFYAQMIAPVVGVPALLGNPYFKMTEFLKPRIGKHQYKLTRLIDNQDLPYDTLKVINLMSSFGDLRFEALFTNTLPQERIDSITNSPYLHYIVVTDKDGNKQDMKTFKKLVLNGVTDIGGELGDVDRDRMYALVDDGKDFVLIQNYVFDKVLHDVRYYEAGHPIQFEMGTVEVYE